LAELVSCSPPRLVFADTLDAMVSTLALLAHTVSLLALASGVAGSNGGVSCHQSPQAACECLLACNVFGGNAGLCNSKQDKKAIVHEAVNTHLREEHTLCDGMGCVVACSKKLGCLDDSVQEKCQATARANLGCNLNCSDSRRSARVTQALMFVVSLAAIIAATAGTPSP